MGQVGLVLELLWRQAVRSGGTGHRARAVWRLVLPCAFLAQLTYSSWLTTRRDVLQVPDTAILHLLGMLIVSAALGMFAAIEGAGRARERAETFLDPLPLSTLARHSLRLLKFTPIIILACSVMLGAHVSGESSTVEGFGVAALGSAEATACLLAGYAVMLWIRALASVNVIHSVYAGSWVIFATGAAASELPWRVLGFGKVAQLDFAARAATRYLRSLSHPTVHLGLAFCGVALAASFALWGAERFGYDYDQSRRSVRRLYFWRTPAALELSMMLRQGGKAALGVFVSVSLALGAIALTSPSLRTTICLDVYARVGFVFGVVLIVHQAMRAARADLAAAALLTALPRRVGDVLDDRSRALRWLLMPVSLILIACGSAYVARSEWILLCRAGLLLSALYVAVRGATAIAYLCAGLGTAFAQPDHIHAGQIWFVPLLTVAIARDLRATVVAWLATYAMSWAARRAAIMTMRDGLEPPETDPAPVWRALIAGGLFCTIQALARAQLVWFGASQRYAFAIAVALAAGWLIGASRVEDKRTLHWVPTRASVWLLGTTCGVMSGLIALGVHRSLYPSQIAAPLLSTGEWVVSFIALALLAPLAEERFFRGWLQNAIATELPETSRRWAFAISAVVFALFHIDSDVVPQLILGLVAGALFAFGGGLGPAVVAHCAHNLTVLVAAAQLH